MTAVCAGGGTSSPKSGQADLVIWGAGSIASMLNNRGRFWASIVAPFLGVMSFNLPTFCAGDPPPIPTISALEVAELLALSGVLASDATKKKFDDMVRNAVWYLLCQCDAGAQPVAPALPNAPVGLPDTSRLYNGSGTNLPCLVTFNNADHSTNLALYKMLDNPDQNGDSTLIHWPTGAKDIRTHASLTLHGANHASTWRTVIRWYGASGQVDTQSGAFHAVDGSVYTDDFATAAVGVIYASVELSTNAVGTATDLAFVQAEVFCGGPPGSPQVPCCPADQFQTAMMQKILDYVTLLQRQLAPFAHVLGATHAALSGQGTLGVNGLLGVKLELTTIPASYGVEVGSPDFHFDVGWLSVMTPDGLIDERRISAQTTQWMPRLMSDATVVGYSLSPGVVGTLTELVREP